MTDGGDTGDDRHSLAERGKSPGAYVVVPAWELELELLLRAATAGPSR